MLRLYVICVALAASACSGGEAKQLEKIRDEVCACKTATCAEAALERVPKGKVESTPRTQHIAREMMNCVAALYEQDRPTQDPDAPVTPEANAPEATAPGTSDPPAARRP